MAAPENEILSLNKAAELRRELVALALRWEDYLGVAPSITNAVSELDAAMLVGMSEPDYCLEGKGRTAVSRGRDFTHGGVRYQITANRPSGKRGSPVTKVALKTEKKKPFEWDRLIWILYNRFFVLQEVWEFDAEEYRRRFSGAKRLGPNDMRKGRNLLEGAISN